MRPIDVAELKWPPSPSGLEKYSSQVDADRLIAPAAKLIFGLDGTPYYGRSGAWSPFDAIDPKRVVRP